MSDNCEGYGALLEKREMERRTQVETNKQFRELVQEQSAVKAQLHLEQLEREFWELCCASYNNETPILDGYTHRRGTVNASTAAAIADRKLEEWRKRWLRP